MWFGLKSTEHKKTYQDIGKRMKFFQSLRARLFLLFALAVIIIGGPTYLYLDNVYVQRTLQERGDRMFGMTGAAAALIADEIKERKREMALFAQEPYVADKPDLKQLQASMARRQKTYPRYSWIGLTDNTGHVLAATGNLLVGVDTSKREWYQEGQKGVYVGDLHEAVLLAKHLNPDNTERLRFIDFAAPVVRPDGAVAGVIAAHVHWGWIKDILVRLPSASYERTRVELFIFNKEGVQIYPETNTPTVLPADLASDVVFAVRKWEDGISYGTSSLAVQDVEGQSLQWRVVARRPMSAMMADVDELRFAMIWLKLLASVVLFGMLFWGISHISRPIGQVARFAREVEQGNENAELGIRHANREVLEVRNLVKAVKGMAQTLIHRKQALEESNALLETKVTERTRELERLREEAEEQARTDPLTGLLNRRGFSESAARLISLAERSGRPLSLFMLDIDHFKRVNDTWGHDAGDEVLVAISRAMQENKRAADLAVRLGGEEFAILLPDTDMAGATALAEKLRRSIQGMTIHTDGVEIQATCSFGVAASKLPGIDLDDLLRRSDAALYFSKTHGRNKVSVEDELTPA